MRQKLIAYYRVSTAKQGASGLGLEGQEAAVMDYAGAADDTVLRAYTEVETGKRSDRPELAHALADCKRSKAVLVIAKLDRLARNVHFLSRADGIGGGIRLWRRSPRMRRSGSVSGRKPPWSRTRPGVGCSGQHGRERTGSRAGPTQKPLAGRGSGYGSGGVSLCRSGSRHRRDAGRGHVATADRRAAQCRGAYDQERKEMESSAGRKSAEAGRAKGGFMIMTRWLVCLLAMLVTAPALAETSDQDAVIQGNNTFAVELYGQLRNQSGNLFFSPESISTALAMTYAGARGETAAEMARTLHFTLPPERLHPAMGGLLREMNTGGGSVSSRLWHVLSGGDSRGYQLSMANALWMQKDYAFLDGFLKLTQDNYGAGLNTVDFRGESEEARQAINQWVEQQTTNKITDLIQAGVLKPDTRLVLTNTVYFKGDWEKQFDKAQTRDEQFHVTAMQNIKAPLMHITGDFNYMNGGTFQALEMPYKGKDLSMVVFLPNAPDGLPAFEQSLTLEKMAQWLGRLQPAKEVRVTFPKFKMTRQFGLKQTLDAMGMRQAFDDRKADFSGMASREVMLHYGNLYIKNVIHKSYVDVNEEGTEAAAAAAVMVADYAMAHPIFRVDHPFLFLIRDNRSGSILFMGRVEDPSTVSGG